MIICEILILFYLLPCDNLFVINIYVYRNPPPLNFIIKNHTVKLFCFLHVGYLFFFYLKSLLTAVFFFKRWTQIICIFHDCFLEFFFFYETTDWFINMNIAKSWQQTITWFHIFFFFAATNALVLLALRDFSKKHRNLNMQPLILIALNRQPLKRVHSWTQLFHLISIRIFVSASSLKEFILFYFFVIQSSHDFFFLDILVIFPSLWWHSPLLIMFPYWWHYHSDSSLPMVMSLSLGNFPPLVTLSQWQFPSYGDVTLCNDNSLPMVATRHLLFW